MNTSRHELLARLHHLLQPKIYMETGVHTGASLNLASCTAIGIDPNPLVAARGNQTIMKMTSDEYFAGGGLPWPVDLGFIDGMHLAEFAYRDFRNMEGLATYNSVIVFDDMLPMNQFMASREMVPGDWTGDVWKVYYVLKETRQDLSLALVDTFPTGTLVVWNLDPEAEMAKEMEWTGTDVVPDEILFRSSARSAEAMVAGLSEWLGR